MYKIAASGYIVGSSDIEWDEVKVIKKVNLTVLCLAALIMGVCLLFTMGKSDSSAVLHSEPAHAVARKWYTDAGRRFYLSEETIGARTLLRTVAETDGTGKNLILKTENLAVTCYTNGRMLYQCKDSGKALLGVRTTVICTDDVKQNAPIYLLLTPAKNRTGKVLSPVYLAENNEYLFTVLSRNRTAMAALGMLAACAVVLLTCIAVFCKGKPKRYRQKCKTLSCLLAEVCLCFMILLTKSDLFAFIAGCSEGGYLLFHAAYLLAGLPLLGLAQTLCARRPEATWLQIITAGYTLLRLLLFWWCDIPLDRGMLLAHALFVSAVAASASLLLNRFLQRFSAK